MVAVADVNESKHVVFSKPEYMFVFAWQAADNFLIKSRCFSFGCPLWSGSENGTE